jgi:uracil-DNA glycosylase
MSEEHQLELPMDNDDPYMPKMRHRPKYIGNPDAPILILIDTPDRGALKGDKPLSGAPLSTMEECLHIAGLITHDVYIETLIPGECDPEKWWSKTKHAPIRDITNLSERAVSIIGSSRAKIVLAMGDIVSYVTCGRRTLSADRGYVFPCSLPVSCKKVMPVQDVKKMIWQNHEWRYYLAGDLKKASSLSSTVELTYDERYPYVVEHFSQAMDVIGEMMKAPVVSVDIEVSNFQVSHMGLSRAADVGWSIPINNTLWSESEEVELWKAIARLLSNESIAKVGQNFIFDMSFLMRQNQIITRGPVLDTMIAQSLLFPDFLKGLNFLGSTYLNVPMWKDTVKFKNIKKES